LVFIRPQLTACSADKSVTGLTSADSALPHNARMQNLRSPLQARVVQWLVAPGAAVRAGDVMVILEAMKMEHEIRASADISVTELLFAAGEMVQEGDLLCTSEPTSKSSRDLAPEKAPNSAAAKPPAATAPAPQADAALPAGRADLQRLVARTAFTLDASRPEAVAKRHALGLRTARENLADLCDAGSFVEYGALAVAAQRTRRSEEDLVQNTPADGMVTGLGTVNGQQVVAMAYDATVLAGTQGMRNHQKTDRMLGLALQNQ
jgi:pyruvate/2-oxoglutarate dehydrogenase complex dihydrolipoamide acyltransferase (E2) component